MVLAVGSTLEVQQRGNACLASSSHLPQRLAMLDKDLLYLEGGKESGNRRFLANRNVRENNGRCCNNNFRCCSARTAIEKRTRSLAESSLTRREVDIK